MELIESLALLHDDELPAALNLANVMEIRGFMRPCAAREFRKAVLQRLTASAARRHRRSSTWLDALTLLAENMPARFEDGLQGRGLR